jgi:glycine oxidase
MHGALLVPGHGYVAARALTSALVTAAANRGATFTRCAVERIADHGSTARIETSNGTFEGDAVIVASGSWSSRFADPAVAPPPVKPIRGQLLVLQQPARVLSRVAWGGRCYVVPWRDGSMLVGATVEDVGFDETATAAGVRSMLDAAIDLMPGLASARFADVRVGLRPATRDELPAIGRSSSMPRVFYATGHYRNGVLLAPLTAQLVADLVLDARTRTELTLTAPARIGL